MESYPLPAWTGQLSFRVLSKTFLVLVLMIITIVVACLKK